MARRSTQAAFQLNPNPNPNRKLRAESLHRAWQQGGGDAVTPIRATSTSAAGMLCKSNPDL